MDKKELIDLYYNKNLSFRDIANLKNTSSAKIRYWFKKYNLKSRSLSESCNLRTKLKPQSNPGRKDMPKKPLYGKDNPAYKKGWWITSNGYKKISWLGNEILEHHYIWSIIYKKEIPQGHQIHHINGDKLDNRIENLECLSNSEHQKLHNSIRKRCKLGRYSN